MFPNPMMQSPDGGNGLLEILMALAGQGGGPQMPGMGMPGPPTQGMPMPGMGGGIPGGMDPTMLLQMLMQMQGGGGAMPPGMGGMPPGMDPSMMQPPNALYR